MYGMRGKNKWNGKDKEVQRRVLQCSLRITYSSYTFWFGFGYSRYGHIHKLIKMFNQSNTKKKSLSSFAELSAVSVLFFSSFFLHKHTRCCAPSTKYFHLFPSLTTFNQRTSAGNSVKLWHSFIKYANKIRQIHEKIRRIKKWVQE